MIRPRVDSAYHDCRFVFDDLRSGRLTVAEYEVMVAEDLLETTRRSEHVAYRREEVLDEIRLGGLSGIEHMASLTPEQDTEINNEAKAFVPEAEGGKGDDYPTKDEARSFEKNQAEHTNERTN